MNMLRNLERMRVRPGPIRLLRKSAATMMLLALAACATTGTAGPRASAAATPATANGAAAPGAPAPGAAAPDATAPDASAPPTEAAAPDSPSARGATEPAAGETPPERAPSTTPGATGGGDKMLPPCVPVRHARAKHRKPKKAPQAETPAGPPPAPANAVVDAQVSEVGTSLGSILGRDVMSPTGEDLGRVVDVLADVQGNVRVAIIDFGGFLGVGTRRIAVDWPLLRFDLSVRDKPLIMSVDRQKLQSAPEYNPNKPRVLTPPAAPDAADAGQTKK